MKFIFVSEENCFPPIQIGNVASVPTGCARWPDSLSTDLFYAHNGFVTLTIEEVEGVQTVTGCVPNISAWEAWKATLEPSPEPEPVPTVEELQAENRVLRAQVSVLQEQQTFLEDCLLEMADEVYA